MNIDNYSSIENCIHITYFHLILCIHIHGPSVHKIMFHWCKHCTKFRKLCSTDPLKRNVVPFFSKMEIISDIGRGNNHWTSVLGMPCFVSQTFGCWLHLIKLGNCNRICVGWLRKNCLSWIVRFSLLILGKRLTSSLGKLDNIQRISKSWVPTDTEPNNIMEMWTSW
jgi:hypothetical protein